MYQELNRLARIQPTAPVSERGGGILAGDWLIAEDIAYDPTNLMCLLYRLPISE